MENKVGRKKRLDTVPFSLSLDSKFVVKDKKSGKSVMDKLKQIHSESSQSRIINIALENEAVKNGIKIK